MKAKEAGTLITQAMENSKAPELLEKWKREGVLEKRFPELHKCIGVDGGGYHDETIYEHLIDCLRYASKHPVHIQWAALLHDIGKPDTRAVNHHLDGTLDRISFHKHEIVGASIAYEVCKRFGLKISMVRKVVRLVRQHMFRFQLDSSDKTIQKWLTKIGSGTWQDLFLLRIADRKANRKNVNKPIITKAMKDLEKQILKIEKNTPCLYFDDLNIPPRTFKKLLKDTGVSINEAYSNIMGLINSDPSRNNRKWIHSYVKRIYRKENKVQNTDNQL